MSKVMGIYVKFTKTAHQIWSCHVTLASNSPKFYFLPNSVLNFRESYQIWGNLAQEQKVTGEKQIWGGKHPLPVLMGLTQLKLTCVPCFLASPLSVRSIMLQIGFTVSLFTRFRQNQASIILKSMRN